MAFFQTDNARGFIQSPRALNAGDVKCARSKFIFSTAFAFAADKLELIVLPPFCRVVDAILLGDVGGANNVTIGLMSGNPGVNDSARTIGSELFAAVSANAAMSRPSALTAFRIQSSDTAISLGATFSANIAASVANTIELLLFYAPQSN